VHALLDNLGLKLASLGLASLLWFVIAGEKTSEMGLKAPVELQNFPKDLELTGEPVNLVEVRVRAAPGIIQHLGLQGVSAQIDVAGLAEGEHIVHLTQESIRLPFGVKVVKINPAIVTLKFERTMQKAVPVRPRIVGHAAPGYELEEIRSDPAEIRIAGPKSRIEAIEGAFTEAVSIDGAQTAVAESVNIGLEDPLLRIQGSPRVRVTARVREVQETRSFDAVAVEVRDAAGTARPPRVKIAVTGPPAAVRRLRPEDVRAYVEGGRAMDGGRLMVGVEVGSGDSNLKAAAEPGEVTFVRLRKKG
jgi:YbbR domain-containing protein